MAILRVFEASAFEAPAFGEPVFDVPVFDVPVSDVTALNLAAPVLSVTDLSPPEAPESSAAESPAAAFAVDALFAIYGSLTLNPLAALPPPRRTLEGRSEGNDGDSSVARSRERARDGVSLAASAM